MITFRCCVGRELLRRVAARHRKGWLGMEIGRDSPPARPRPTVPSVIAEGDPLFQSTLPLRSARTCDCKSSHINCMSAKEWLRSQVGVWQFVYEKRDVRDKNLHPATFPISLATRVIELLTHRGELVLDPFVGSGTTLVAARDTERSAVGFDLSGSYVELCASRLDGAEPCGNGARQLAIHDDARNTPLYLEPESVALIWTSPPYANLLNRERRNKSRRKRDNEQLGRVEQYSQDPRDLGTMELDDYAQAMGDIFERLLPVLRPRAHCVVNVPDMWWENRRITIHVSLIESLIKFFIVFRQFFLVHIVSPPFFLSV